jgi:5'-phosphate synthase pdxT subunit
MKIGILALQGDVAAHAAMLREADPAVQVVEVREAGDLSGLDGLLIPGGESTTMSRLCDRYGLWEPLRRQIDEGLGVFGTCAGLIMLSRNLEGATKNFSQSTLGALDIDVARNAYGAQLDSFETDVDVPLLDSPGGTDTRLRAVFIRAPRIQRVGEDVEVLAEHNGVPVAVRQGKIFGAAFHPEIAGDARLHRLWLHVLENATANDFAVAPSEVLPEVLSSRELA